MLAFFCELWQSTAMQSTLTHQKAAERYAAKEALSTGKPGVMKTRVSSMYGKTGVDAPRRVDAGLTREASMAIRLYTFHIYLMGCSIGHVRVTLEYIQQLMQEPGITGTIELGSGR